MKKREEKRLAKERVNAWTRGQAGDQGCGVMTAHLRLSPSPMPCFLTLLIIFLKFRAVEYQLREIPSAAFDNVACDIRVGRHSVGITSHLGKARFLVFAHIGRSIEMTFLEARVLGR